MIPHVVILGAGPAGLGAAFQLTRRNLARVTVIEQRPRVGGNAGSFPVGGFTVDYGSHRLHPACEPRILNDLQQLLGDDLLLRPRHGRIRLRNRWIRFPLRPVDLALRLPPSFLAGVAWDTLRKPFAGPSASPETFATVLERGLGRTICRDFYFPYARKIWGAEPQTLSAVQAHRRVSGNSPARMLRKIAHAIPGLGPKMAGRFYYPRQGYGQISECLAQAVRDAGGTIMLDSQVTAAARTDEGWVVNYTREGKPAVAPGSLLWSTIPASVLVKSLSPLAPPPVLDAAGRLQYRAMLLIYLIVEQPRFTEFDAHYFPEESMPLSRLSEPRNYSCVSHPRDVTVLCGELPCDLTSSWWKTSDEQLGQAMAGWLASVGLPLRGRIVQTVVRRLSHAYPLYSQGYQENFDAIDGWLGGIEGLLTFGRQGLFAHDNLHHALRMAYSAVDCLGPDGVFDRTRWAGFRQSFEQHVVED